MKNKNIFFKICISILSIFILTLIILLILGNKTRIGYLGEFNFNGHHINKTLELNGINPDDIKKLFIVDEKNNILDNASLINYIYTNEAITNYSYNFKVQYYSKIFKNSDIYGVYIDTNKILEENNFIKEIKMNDDKGTPFGNLISTKKLTNSEKIDNVNYILKVNSRLKFIFYIVIFTFTLYFIINYISSKYDKAFIFFAIAIGLSLFLFQFWVGFPGSNSLADNYTIMLNAINEKYDNWNPILPQIMLSFLYKTFGYQWFYLFLITLICFYGGLTFIVLGLYLKFKNTKVIFLFLIAFIENIYSFHFTQMKDVLSPAYLWLAYSLILFLLLTNFNKKINIIIYTAVFLNIIFSLLFRLNAIVTIYPIFILFSYKILKDKNYSSKIFISKFILSMFIFALLLISISKIPQMLVNIEDRSRNNIPPTNHIILLQIAGCAALSDDGSMIPDEWYEEGKNFESLKEQYFKNPINGDHISAPWDKNNIIKSKKLDNLKLIWIKYILKHPISYIKHTFNFIKHQWYMTNSRVVEHHIYETLPHSYEILDYLPHYDSNDFKLQVKYFYYIKNNLIKINYIYPILSAILLFFVSGLLWIFKNNFRTEFLLLTFCSSFASFATALIVVLFSPVTNDRYIYPVLLISIISIISFITFIYDIGGFKTFLTELKSIKLIGNEK